MQLLLKDYRKRAGLSQRDIAATVGKSVRTVQMWESGDSLPDIKCLLDLCEMFNTDPDSILGWDKAFESGPVLSHDERLLIEDYRSCTPSRKAAISSMTRDMAGMSKLSKTTSDRVDRAG